MAKKRWTLVLEGEDGPVPTVVRIRRLLKVAWRSMALKAVAVAEAEEKQTNVPAVDTAAKNPRTPF
jgi:hypothetical protein